MFSYGRLQADEGVLGNEQRDIRCDCDTMPFRYTIKAVSCSRRITFITGCHAYLLFFFKGPVVGAPEPEFQSLGKC